MPRLKPLIRTEATGKVRNLLDGVQKKLGSTPNVMLTMANSPAVLEAYLSFSAALARGSLPASLREQIALVVAESNGCDYCLAAHGALGRMAGLSDADIADSRRATSVDLKIEAVLTFAQQVVRERGRVSDADIERLRAAGFNDGYIAEIVANVVVNLFTNYLNHVAETDVDFPEVEALQPSPACAC